MHCSDTRDSTLRIIDGIIVDARPRTVAVNAMDDHIKPYGKVIHVGRPETRRIFEGPVVIEEKIDGSQFSFGVFDGVLMASSRRRTLDIDKIVYGSEVGLFFEACKTVISLKDLLVDDWTYRGEVLSKPKHNILCYDRVPRGNIILWEISDSRGCLDHELKSIEADRLGIEVVPKLFEGHVYDIMQLDCIKETVSILGGENIEGFVVKNYNGEFTKAKWVCEAMREVQGKSKEKNRSDRKNPIDAIAEKYTSANRWQKAVQHLRDENRLSNSYSDIGPLIGEAQKDLHSECADAIKNELFRAFWKEIAKKSTSGLADWYKDYLSDEFQEKGGFVVPDNVKLERLFDAIGCIASWDHSSDCESVIRSDGDEDTFHNLCLCDCHVKFANDVLSEYA